MNPIHRRAIIHFTDNTTLDLEWPKQDRPGATFVSEALRKPDFLPALTETVDLQGCRRDSLATRPRRPTGRLRK